MAVIGSGPAGLTAAVRLAQLGYGVTVFEKLPVPGGMMSCAIPEYRLPRQPLFLEIENIQRAGVEIRCRQSLGKDFTLDELLDRAGLPRPSCWPSARIAAARSAFRARKNPASSTALISCAKSRCESCRRVQADSGEIVELPSGGRAATLPDLRGKRVGIVGGGDVAIDAARVALRLGAREVHVMYRRTGDDMPATHLPEEIEGALHEGVRFHTLVNPAEVLGERSVTGVRLVRQRLAEFDNTRPPQTRGHGGGKFHAAAGLSDPRHRPDAGLVRG